VAAIVGFGGYVPDRVMTNDDWARLVDTSDEWIVTRTGIRERRIAADDQSTADLAQIAAERALDDAGLDPSDIDEIIVATDTPEVYTPDTASFLQHRMGMRNVPAYDLGGSGCAGFVQALDIARSRVTTPPRRILVVGVEVIMRLLTWEERATSVLFGDGAGAVVVAPEGGKARILDVLAGTDGSKADILTLSVGGTKEPFCADHVRTGAHRHLTMNGGEVFREAVRRMSAAVEEIADRIGVGVGDIALVIPHQANKRIIDAVGSKLRLDPERVYVNVDRFGNTGSASVPLALWEAQASGCLSPGDLVVLTAFGAGFHWAAAALQF
jgi:3-oxoacyl-[acyl-carrier-protein] synthase-3